MKGDVCRECRGSGEQIFQFDDDLPAEFRTCRRCGGRGTEVEDESSFPRPPKPGVAIDAAIAGFEKALQDGPKRKALAMEHQNKMKNEALVSVRDGLNQMEAQIRAVLPPHVTLEKFSRVVMTAVQNNPELLQADRKSLFMACLKSAQDGLLPDGREAALVVFKSKDNGPLAQYLPMVQGLLKKVRNSNQLASLSSEVIFQNDKFRYWVDDAGKHLEHEPLLFGDRGKPIGVYAVAKMKDGAVYSEIMNEKDIQVIKNSSRAKNGPWSGPFELEMWRKTVVRRLSKLLPSSTDIERDENEAPEAIPAAAAPKELEGPAETEDDLPFEKFEGEGK